nr:ABC transporter ATP-binding protein [Gordonibacter massiliensis (ex Traore et al. 2017)]
MMTERTGTPAKERPSSAASVASSTIRMERLAKRYPMGDEVVHALDGIDFCVDEGEFVAIVGLSGSGKTTLMNIIGLLDVPDDGTYTLDGQDVALLADNELADLRNRSIGFVFQSFNLLGSLTALENVKLPLTYRGTRPREADATARRYLAKVGLEGRERHLPSQLSGGQQQRVAIARALVGEPRIILADEPTGALDSHTSVEIMELFKSLHREGQTVILITHNPDLAEQAERVVRIADGRLGASEHGHEGVRLAVCDTAGGNDAAPATAVARAAAEREGEAHATRANG